MSETLIEALQLAMETHQSQINTSVPGTIVSYDPSTNRATVRPALSRRLANGEELHAPNIVQVPVVFPTAGMNTGKQAAFTMPIAPGDGVELTFQQRCLENWLSGRTDAPNDPRQFDLSDCVATPGLNAGGVVGDPTNVVLRFDKASVILRPDNSIVVGNDNGSITITEDGTIVLKGTSIVVDTPSNSYTMELHRHTGVMPGPGDTGIPI
jgi:hypothetical protein